MSDSNVTPIPSRPVPAENEPVQEVVEYLENLLERARKGEIRAIAMAASLNGEFACSWTTEQTEYANAKARLLAGVALLQHRMVVAMNDYCTE